MHPYTSNIPVIAQELNKMHIAPKHYERKPANLKLGGLIFVFAIGCILGAVF